MATGTTPFNAVLQLNESPDGSMKPLWIDRKHQRKIGRPFRPADRTGLGRRPDPSSIVHRDILDSRGHGVGSKNMPVIGVDAKQRAVPRSGHREPCPAPPVEGKALHAWRNDQGFGGGAFVDFAAGMPMLWSWSEGPSTVLAGLAYVWLARRAR